MQADTVAVGESCLGSRFLPKPDLWAARLALIIHKGLVHWVEEQVDAIDDTGACAAALHNQQHDAVPGVQGPKVQCLCDTDVEVVEARAAEVQE